MFSLKRFFSAIVGTVMSANILIAMPYLTFAETNDENVYRFSFENYTVDYEIKDGWGDTEVISLTLSNTGTETIENWMLYFDPHGDIQYVDDAYLMTTADGTEYIKNAGYNADIVPGSKVTFEYAVSDCEEIPSDYRFCQSRMKKEDGYDVSLKVNQTWGDSDEYFNGEIIIQNYTDDPIEAWELTVDTNFTITEITNSWAASVVEIKPYNYLLKGTYTGTVPANSSVSLGFIGVSNGTPEISGFSMTAVYADFSNFDISLKCNKTRISTDETDTEIYFYAETDLDVEKINLFDSTTNQVVATMYDDGKYTQHGDDLPYDGVYSCRMSIDNSEKAYLSYYAKHEPTNSISNYVGIKVYVPLTSEDFDEMNEVDTALNNLYAQSGYNSMTFEQKQDAVLQLLTTLATSGTDAYPYSLIYENSIIFNGHNLYTFTYKCGVLGAARIEDFSDESNGIREYNEESLENNFSNDENINTEDEIVVDSVNLGNIYIMYAFDDTTSWRYPYYTEMEQKWEEAGIDVTLDTDVTVDDFKHLDNYDATVFSMHGDYYSENTPVLVTYETMSPEKDSLYAEDLACGDITKAYSHYAILPSFFTDNYNMNELNDAIIFSESCCFYGEKEDVCYSMSEVLIDSGASTVTGFHNSVNAVYSREIMEKFIDELVNGNTTGNALDVAKSIYGENDGKSIYAAYPIIDGNKSKMLHPEGIGNGNFEDGEKPLLWKYDGDTRVLRRLGAFRPTNGSYMCYISTGIGSQEIDYLNATEGSVITQTFKIPSGATTLSFNYNIISEEPLEYLGTQYDDTFKAILYNSNGTESIEMAYESIKNSDSSEWTIVPNLDFEGGDSTTYTLGWKNTSVDVSAYAGSFVTLKFCIYDAGDSIYDSIALIDEVNIV